MGWSQTFVPLAGAVLLGGAATPEVDCPAACPVARCCQGGGPDAPVQPLSTQTAPTARTWAIFESLKDIVRHLSALPLALRAVRGGVGLFVSNCTRPLGLLPGLAEFEPVDGGAYPHADRQPVDRSLDAPHHRADQAAAGGDQ